MERAMNTVNNKRKKLTKKSTTVTRTAKKISIVMSYMILLEMYWVCLNLEIHIIFSERRDWLLVGSGWELIKNAFPFTTLIFIMSRRNNFLFIHFMRIFNKQLSDKCYLILLIVIITGTRVEPNWNLWWLNTFIFLPKNIIWWLKSRFTLKDWLLEVSSYYNKTLNVVWKMDNRK